MNLILWRHAEAEDAEDDLARRLTPRGQRQAAAMAHWLRPRLPAGFALLASPAARSRQTAAALTGITARVDARIAPDRSVADHLAAIDWPAEASKQDATIVLVGHQPTLGRLASLLLAGREIGWSVRKGAVWWLATRDRDAHAQAQLRLVISPEQLEP